MKILLVEDDDLLQQLYMDILTGAGYDVTLVGDGLKAYARIREGGYDLILLDQVLPGMTGLEVMQKLRSETLPDKTNWKVVFMTNVDDSNVIKDMLAVSDGYIMKGALTPDQFLKKVQEYLH